MKHAFLLGILFLSLSSIAQTPGQKIDVIGNQRFEQNGKRLNPMMLLKIIENDPIAHTEMKKARKAYVAASVIGGIGGFLFGGQLGTVAGGGEANWGVFGTGVAIALVSIPISVGSTKKMRASINHYNSNLGFIEPETFHKVTYHLNFTGNGLGLKVQF
ncbi:MAG: hypothetical protein ACI8ZO_001748 [Flavobacteriales bacterium]|jgi:hypothetical protein